MHRRDAPPAIRVDAALRRFCPGRTRPEYFEALSDVAFDVPWGEAVGIVDRNGAGKGTRLTILTRMTAPTSGRADVGGVGIPLEVGARFHPELTGWKNVYLNGTLLGMKRRDSSGISTKSSSSPVSSRSSTPGKRFSTWDVRASGVRHCGSP